MNNLKDITTPPQTNNMLTAAQMQSGPPVTPTARILAYDPEEWERFIEEWVYYCLASKYSKVMRSSGSNDRGIDIAAFLDDKHLFGVWDNYQCKHYDKGITPSNAWVEIGKILWHSFNKHYRPPRSYYFIAPRGVGTTLNQLLCNTTALKQELIKSWKRCVENKITTEKSVTLEGEFGKYVNSFDFAIFKPATTLLEIIEQFRNSPNFIIRFGGALPSRPTPNTPPTAISPSESTYISHLLTAYSEHTGQDITDVDSLKAHKTIFDHFGRQRECFYQAESLRVFVRDKVTPGTFEGLQNEIYDGVIDTCESSHENGFLCVKAVTNIAQSIDLNGHALGASTLVKDKRGICHQLANENRLKWTK